MTTNDKNIVRVFISSTFRDMNKERDLLQTKVFTQLRFWARKLGVLFIPVDLRWGITEKDIKSGKLKELCLSMVKTCNPYFVGLLGNCYGSTGKKLLGDTRGKSITQLEIEERLKCNDIEGLHIYRIRYSIFKEKNIIKKIKLKRFIRELNNNYNNIVSIDREDRLVLTIVNDLKETIKRKFNQFMPQNNLEHDQFVYNNLYQSYYISDTIYNKAKTYYKIGLNNFTIFKGINHFQEDFFVYNLVAYLGEEHKKVAFHDFSISEYSLDKQGFMKHVIDILEPTYANENVVIDEELFYKTICDKEEIVFIVSSIGLLDEVQTDAIMQLLYSISGKHFVWITDVKSAHWCDVGNIVVIEALNENEIVQYAYEYLQFFYKTANQELAKHMCSMIAAQPNCKNLTFLHVVLDVIVQNGCPSNKVIETLGGYLQCNNLEELLYTVLTQACSQDKLERLVFIGYIIATAYRHVMVSDIERLFVRMGWNILDVNNILELIYNYIIIVNNKVFCKYQEFKNLMIRCVKPEMECKIKKLLEDYYSSIIQENAPSTHNLEELSYLLYKSNRIDDIMKLLFSRNNFNFALQHCIKLFSLIKDVPLENKKKYIYSLFNEIKVSKRDEDFLQILKYLRYDGDFGFAIELVENYGNIISDEILFYKALLLRETEKYKESIEILEPLYEKLEKNYSQLLLSVCDVFTYCCSKINNIDKKTRENAISIAKNCLNLREINKERNEYDMPITLNSLASFYFQEGEYEKARELYVKARDIRIKYLGVNSVRVAANNNNIAATFMRERKYNEAIKLFKDCLEVLSANLNEGHFYILKCNLNKILCELFGEIRNVQKEEIDFLEQKLANYDNVELIIMLNICKLSVYRCRDNSWKELYDNTVAMCENNSYIYYKRLIKELEDDYL